MKLKWRRLVSRVAVLPLAVFLVFGSNAWVDRSKLVEEALFLVGTLLVGIGVIGRVWSLSHIGGKKRRELVTTGPFSLCRNPLYLFSLTGGLGLALCTETLTIPLLVAIGFFLIYVPTIRVEERMLAERFGAEYEEYRRRVPTRLWPSLRSYSEEATMVVSGHAFRKGILDLVVFVVLIGVFDFLESLHQSGALKTLFRIY